MADLKSKHDETDTCASECARARLKMLPREIAILKQAESSDVHRRNETSEHPRTAQLATTGKRNGYHAYLRPRLYAAILRRF